MVGPSNSPDIAANIVPITHGPSPDAQRVRARDVHQIGIVDHRAHADAETGPPEEEIETDRRNQRDHHGDQLVVPDVDVEDPERLGGEEVGEQHVLSRFAPAVAPEREHARDAEREADHADDLVLRADLGEHAREELEQQPHDRAEHEQAQDRSELPRRPRARAASRDVAPRPRRSRRRRS